VIDPRGVKELPIEGPIGYFDCYSSVSASSVLSDAEQIAQLKQPLQWAELKIQVLEERLRLQLIAKYGPASEKLNEAQRELLEQEPGVSRPEVEVESARVAEPSLMRARERRSPPGRQELPSHLPRREQVLLCPPEQCTCQACGGETTVKAESHFLSPRRKRRGAGESQRCISNWMGDGR
jgi:hypothetical protein